MAKVVKRTFSLTEEQAAFIDAKVESGDFASGSEVLRAGLRAMEAREQLIDRWMREEVLPVMDRVKTGREKLLSASEVRARLRAEYERVAKAAE